MNSYRVILRSRRTDVVAFIGIDVMAESAESAAAAGLFAILESPGPERSERWAIARVDGRPNHELSGLAIVRELAAMTNTRRHLEVV